MQSLTYGPSQKYGGVYVQPNHSAVVSLDKKNDGESSCFFNKKYGENESVDFTPKVKDFGSISLRRERIGR